MSLLDTIHGPTDLRRLPRTALPGLADEVRQRLIEVVSQTGGHIGAGLGVVELTVALLHAFDSPSDRIVWDVGHQGYPWKILTRPNPPLPGPRGCPAGGGRGGCRASCAGTRARTTSSVRDMRGPRCRPRSAWRRPETSAARAIMSSPWSGTGL